MHFNTVYMYVYIFIFMFANICIYVRRVLGKILVF